jgi:hypothetical protein
MGKSPLGFAGFYGAPRPLDHVRPETFFAKFLPPTVIQMSVGIVKARWTRWITPDLRSASGPLRGPVLGDGFTSRKREIA